MSDTTNKIEEIRAALEGATPGPWRVGHDTEEGWPAMLVTAKGWDIATAWGGYNAAENDTRLIALAPDMARIVLAAEKLAATFEDRLALWEAGPGDEEAWRILSEYRKAGEGRE